MLLKLFQEGKMMKIIDKYIISSILKIAIVAILIFALILAAVELFSKMDSIMTGGIEIPKLIEYLLYSIPEYLLMGSGLAFLFASTYFLSSLTANNERIALLNAGLSKTRLSMPVIILAIIITLLGFAYQEYALNRIIAKHDQLEIDIFGASGTKDTRNIVLHDENGYLVYTRRYSEVNNEILNPILIKSSSGKLEKRIESEYAIYEDGHWVFHNCTIYDLTDGVSSTFAYTYVEDAFTIEPHLFRTENTSIETMSGKDARAYLDRLKVVDPQSWQEKATDYYTAFFQPLGIFILMFISVSMSYHFKKNVLLFSIIQSLSIAVVYYVGDMVFSIASHQGAIHPYASVALPLMITIMLSWVISLLGKKL